MTEWMGRQMFPENRYWRCRRDAQRQSVPQSRSSDRKSSVINILCVWPSLWRHQLLRPN